LGKHFSSISTSFQVSLTTFQQHQEYTWFQTTTIETKQYGSHDSHNHKQKGMVLATKCTKLAEEG
jgi:hypothetical protein